MRRRRRQLELLLELAERQRQAGLRQLATRLQATGAAQARHAQLAGHLQAVHTQAPGVRGVAMADRRVFLDRLRLAVDAQAQVLREERRHESAAREQLAWLDTRQRALRRLVVERQARERRHQRRRQERELSDAARSTLVDPLDEGRSKR